MAFRPCLTRLSKHSSSRQWIARQFSDPYVKKRLADPSAYRSRAAFKLLEIDNHWDNFLSKRDVQAVVDLGAAPGGWSQVVAGKFGFSPDGYAAPSRGATVDGKSGGWSAPVDQEQSLKIPDTVGFNERPRSTKPTTFDPLNIDGVELSPAKKTPGKGTIIAVDLLRMQPINGVHSIVADFLAPDTAELVRGLLLARGCPSGKVDVILSDMAANVSGNDIHDVQCSLEICEAVLAFAEEHLRTAKSIGRKRGGVLLMKYFAHPELDKFRVEKLEPRFHLVRPVKPASSRAESSESYFLCQGWKEPRREALVHPNSLRVVDL